ncbi:TPA: hypothetical protein ACPYV3_001338 [Citrobacter freundii]|uniref:hypothetical protein n=1 Tax=Citrobacter freundii TaxID=546 RepID=UPI000FE37D71|nr:hypothetical protein [Citrobacter freundii]EJG2167805.1 hypothetical protein [Citrobacter freundii 47N]EKT9387580.1 hypothetical protein [Citrobacter freundii]EKU1806195.1 hypothetical protein [Citrobacter freundii]EKU8470118.1 hypothetical protein [Citrobacter freundii]EKU8533568.1 hypothetical protein [Citrobacter freundii]
MRDIYHQLVKHPHEFKSLTNEDLAETSDLYAAGAFAINSALTLIGNLAHDATTAEDYADEDARRDLVLVSHVLRHLPRMALALNQSSEAADYVRAQRRTAGEQS